MLIFVETYLISISASLNSKSAEFTDSDSAEFNSKYLLKLLMSIILVWIWSLFLASFDISKNKIIQIN